MSTPADASSTPYLSGVITDLNGNNAAGSTVTLVVWPQPSATDDADGASTVGQTVTLKTIATTHTTAGGHYSIANPTLTGLGSAYTSDDGTLNLEVETTDDDGVSQSNNFSAADTSAPEATNAVADWIAVPGVQAQTISLNDQAGTVTTALGRNQKFMDLYTYGSTTIYQKTDHHETLGVGVDYGGGGWKASAGLSLEVSSSVEGGSPTTLNRAVYNKVNYRVYRRSCTGIRSYYDYVTRPSSFHDLFTDKTTIAPRNWNEDYCDPHYAGQGYETKSEGTNETFSTGVAAPYVNVESHSSYSTLASVKFVFTKPVELLCGSSTAGFANAPFSGGEEPPGGGCGTTGVTSATVKPNVKPDC